MTIGFQPTGDNVLVHLFPAEEAGPDNMVAWAEVIAVGPGRCIADGMLVPPDFAPGDRIALRPHAALHLHIDGQLLAIAGGSDVLGVLLRQARRSRPLPEPNEPGVTAMESQAHVALREESLETDVAPDLLDQEAATAEDLH